MSGGAGAGGHRSSEGGCKGRSLLLLEAFFTDPGNNVLHGHRLKVGLFSIPIPQHAGQPKLETFVVCGCRRRRRRPFPDDKLFRHHTLASNHSSRSLDGLEPDHPAKGKQRYAPLDEGDTNRGDDHARASVGGSHLDVQSGCRSDLGPVSAPHLGTDQLRLTLDHRSPHDNLIRHGIELWHEHLFHPVHDAVPLCAIPRVGRRGRLVSRMASIASHHHGQGEQLDILADGPVRADKLAGVGNAAGIVLGLETARGHRVVHRPLRTARDHLFQARARRDQRFGKPVVVNHTRVLEQREGRGFHQFVSLGDHARDGADRRDRRGNQVLRSSSSSSSSSSSNNLSRNSALCIAVWGLPHGRVLVPLGNDNGRRPRCWGVDLVDDIRDDLRLVGQPPVPGLPGSEVGDVPHLLSLLGLADLGRRLDRDHVQGLSLFAADDDPPKLCDHVRNRDPVHVVHRLQQVRIHALVREEGHEHAAAQSVRQNRARQKRHGSGGRGGGSGGGSGRGGGSGGGSGNGSGNGRGGGSSGLVEGVEDVPALSSRGHDEYKSACSARGPWVSRSLSRNLGILDKLRVRVDPLETPPQLLRNASETCPPDPQVDHRSRGLSPVHRRGQ